MTLILTRSDVLRLISAEAVRTALTLAHADLAEGRATAPAPGALRLPDGDGLFLAMPAASARAGLAGVKLLADLPGNAARGLPVQRSVIVVTGTGDGACAAILDGAAVTLFRTAAASAVATQALARPDSRVLGLVGAGAQALAHLTALREALPKLECVVVWSRTERTVRAFTGPAAETGLDVRVAASPEEVVTQAEVLCTLTPSRDPIVRGAWFRPGLHVNAVGSPPRPDHREIDTEGIRRSRVVVDSRATALRESGEVVIPLSAGAITAEHVGDELGEILVGAKPGRTGDEQVTLFKSVGIGLQDVVTARLILDLARERGIGIDADLTA